MKKLFQFILTGILCISLLAIPHSAQAVKYGDLHVLGQLQAGVMQRCFSKEIVALDSYTKLLIHGDSIGDATGKTVTANGDAAVTAAQYKFAEIGRSIILDGDSDYVTLPDSTDWNFGTGDFTIDLWVRFNDLTGIQMLVNQLVDPDTYWTVDKRSPADGNKLRIYFVEREAGGVGLYTMVNEWDVSTGTWYHLAFERIGVTAKIFIDGVSQDLTEAIAFGTNDVGNAASGLYIGGRGDVSAQYFNGWINEVRISKGIVRWTSNFTPSTTPYDGARTVINITELDGDTDEEYRLMCRFINGYDGGCHYGLLFNNDSGNNYGFQQIAATDTSIGALRSENNYVFIGSCDNLSGVCLTDNILYAKSGYVRVDITKYLKNIIGTTIETIKLTGNSWNNTADNVTSIAINSNGANGLGVGTVIELYKKVSKQ